MTRTAVNVIAGTLGVGKTTLVNQLLALRPADERWAVLVNEYGLVGLDAALLADEGRAPGRIDVQEVAGGCICCSAGLMFAMSLARLLEERPDRLLIEPTGLAALSGILDTLERPGIREAVDLRAVLCLLDPSRLEEDLRRPEVRDQVEAADVLLAGRADLATSAQLADFDRWAASLFPPKSFVGHVEHGRLPRALLDHAHGHEGVERHAGHAHGTDHAHDAPPAEARVDASRPIVRRAHRSPSTSTLGWICWAGLVFDAERVSRWLNVLASLSGARRTKAVFRTNEGWWSFNLAGGAEDFRPSGHRRDSRVEVILEGAAFPDADQLERRLRACVVDPSA